MGLLPCGMIYAALLRSVASASVASGSLAMLAFGFGTAGPLFGLGVFSVSVTRWIGLREQNWAVAGVMLTHGHSFASYAPGALMIAAAVKPAPATAPTVRHNHIRRRRIHLFFFAVFCLLPFFNIMRFDIPKQKFYLAGMELWINEFAIIFFSLMFLMFSIVALSMIYGRVYCSYACPQMIFSETVNALEERLRKWVTKKFIAWPGARRELLYRGLTYVIVAAASVVLALSVTSQVVRF
jgi:hypothetical protein